jgi:ribonuclease P protein component
MGVFGFQKEFQKSVDRNYFKRVLRETYRLNKHLLDNLDQPYSLCFFTKRRTAYPTKSTQNHPIV